MLEFDDTERKPGRSDDNRKQKFSYSLNIYKMRKRNKVALAVESVMSFYTFLLNWH